MLSFKNNIIYRVKTAYLPIDEQMVVVKQLVWGILLLTILGETVTVLISVDPLMKFMFSITSVSLIIICCITLLLLRYNHTLSAIILISIGLYAAITVMIIPYGIAQSTLITIMFIMPVILLCYAWGGFGAAISLILTTSSYSILFILESTGLTGWTTQERVYWVDTGLQLMIFILLTVIITQSQKAIMSVNKSLLEVNKNLLEAKQQLWGFTAGLAHDFGMPIQILYAQIHTLDPSKRRISQDQLDLMRAFIEQTRMFLGIQEGKPLNLRRDPVSLVTVAASAMTAISASQALHRNISITLECEDSISDAYVLGDETALRRIIHNLLNNALGVANPNSTITIRIQSLDSYFELAVIDEGAGIPLKDQQHIFEPYWSSSNGARHTGMGWGLGLAIVRQLTVAMQGHCGVVSSPGSGSTFWIRLKQCDPSSS